MSILGRARAFSELFGTLFGGSRNLYQVFGYRTQINYDSLFNKYLRQDIAARIVEAEPHATWSAPPEIITNSPEFDKKWLDIRQKLDIFGKFNRLDKLVGLGQFAVLVLGFDDGMRLDAPLAPGSHNLIYVQPYSENTTTITAYEQDETNPRYGKPLTYRITPQSRQKGPENATSSQPLKPFDVHYTRILHVAENCLEDDTLGIPRLQRIYNLLDDLVKTVGGAAETFWLTANRGMQVDVDKEMDLKPDDAADLADEVDEYFHNLRRVIRTKGVTIKNLGSDVADPRGTFEVIMALVSGSTGIPQRILLGSEAGQLASEQDRANWATRIEERRNLFAEPIILLPFIARMIEAGVLPKVTDMTFKWPDAFRQNPLERAQTSAQQARSLANVSKALSDDVPVVSPEEGRVIIGLTGEVPQFDDARDAHNIGDGNGGNGSGSGNGNGGRRRRTVNNPDADEREDFSSLDVM